MTSQPNSYLPHNPFPLTQLYPNQTEPLSLLRNFIQRRNEISQKITQIYLQTEDEEKRVFQLRNLIFTKPRLQEAIDIQNFLKKTDSSDSNFSRQFLQDLKNDIELSLQSLQKLQDFNKIQKSLPQAEKILKTSHMIESTWQQIYRLSIYDPVLINEVSKLEWNFRAFEVLNHPRADSTYPYIGYCEALKKGALASQSEEIMGNKFYKRIEEELQRHQFLLNKVISIFNQGSQGLSQKMDEQETKELWQGLKQFGFGMEQNAEFVEGILKRAFNLGEKFSELLKKKALISANDLKKFVLQIQSFPIKLSRIQEHLANLYYNQKERVQVVLQETAQRISEKSNELTLRFFKDCNEKNQSFDALMIGTKKISQTCTKELNRITRFRQELMQNLQTFQFEDFCILSGRVTGKGYEEIRAELWLAKARLLQIFCSSLIKPFNPITFEQIRSFLPEIEPYVKSLPDPKRAPFDDQIGFLYLFLHDIQMWIEAEGGKQEIIGKKDLGKVFYGFIDVTQELMRPVKQKIQFMNFGFPVKEVQFKGQNLESLNQKRREIGHETQELDSYEKMAKKIKTQNEIHQSIFCSFGCDIKQNLPSEIIKIE